MKQYKCECIQLIEETARDLRNIKIELDEYISSLQVHYPVYKSDCRKKHFYNQDHNKLRKDLNKDKLPWTKINGLVQTGQQAAIKLLFKS